MNINYKQPQFELFPSPSAVMDDTKRPWFLLASLTLPLESLVILSILAIMIGLFTFSIGVERGKQIAAHALDERVAAAWNVNTHKAVAPVVATVALQSQKKGVPTPVAKAKAVVLPTSKPALVASMRFTAQLSTYKNESFARQEAFALRGKGVQTFLLKSGAYWVVCAGSFPSKETLAGYVKKLPAQYRGSPARRF